MTDTDILTSKQACELLQISRVTLTKIIKRGGIPGGRKVGGTWRFSRRQLVRWVEKGGKKA